MHTITTDDIECLSPSALLFYKHIVGYLCPTNYKLAQSVYSQGKETFIIFEFKETFHF